MNNTYEFKLLTGVKCTVSEMDGSSQSLLTRAGSKEKKMADFNQLIQKHIVSLGSKTDITETDILNLLVSDRKKILVQLRQFSLNFPKRFQFKYTWTEGNTNKRVEQIDWDLTTMFEEKPYNVLTLDQQGKPLFKEMECTEYAEVLGLLENKFILPRSEKKASLTIPTIEHQQKWSKVDSKTFSSHTELQLFQPVTYEKINEGGETRVMIDLDRLTYLDIEMVREIKNKLEGSIDTMIHLQNADNASLTASMDLTQEVSFFFPSRAI